MSGSFEVTASKEGFVHLVILGWSSMPGFARKKIEVYDLVEEAEKKKEEEVREATN